MADTTTGYQFGHLDHYSKGGAFKKNSHKSIHGTQYGKGWSTSDVLAEAARLEGHCGHVDDPKPPGIVFGTFEACQAAADAYADANVITVNCKNGQIYTRAAKTDSPNLAAGVISFPRDRIAEWDAYCDKTMSFLRKKYGDRLRLVVEHLDESHPHLHFYVVPEPGEDFGTVHPGYGASRIARAQPGNLVRTEYKKAMQEWQDELHQDVSEHFGMSRLGPKRARLSREERLLEKRKEAVASKEQELEARASVLDVKEAVIDGRLIDFQKKLAGIERRDGLQVKAQAAIDIGNGDLAKEREKLVRMQKEDEKARDVMRKMYNTMSVAAQLHAQALHPELAVMLGVKNAMDDFGL
jgi:hypothetical protein